MKLSEWSDDKKSMNVNGTITDNDGTEWIENDIGFYAVDGTTLFFGSTSEENCDLTKLFKYRIYEIKITKNSMSTFLIHLGLIDCIS